jgi:hypothetical protein
MNTIIEATDPSHEDLKVIALESTPVESTWQYSDDVGVYTMSCLRIIGENAYFVGTDPTDLKILDAAWVQQVYNDAAMEFLTRPEDAPVQDDDEYEDTEEDDEAYDEDDDQEDVEQEGDVNEADETFEAGDAPTLLSDAELDAQAEAAEAEDLAAYHTAMDSIGKADANVIATLLPAGGVPAGEMFVISAPSTGGKSAIPESKTIHPAGGYEQAVNRANRQPEEPAPVVKEVTVTKTQLFTVPEDIQEQMNQMGRDLQEMREAVNPELVSSLSMIVEALSDSVTQRSRLVTRSFLKMVAHAVRIYVKLEGHALVIGGNPVNPDACENWDNAYMSEVFAHIAQDYRMCKTNLKYGLGELETLRADMVKRNEEIAKLRYQAKLDEEKIKRLENSDAQALKGKNEQLALQLKTAEAERNAAVNKLARYDDLTMPVFALYCDTLNGFIRLHKEEERVSIEQTITDAQLWSSMDKLQDPGVMRLIGQWTAQLATVNKAVSKSDAGLENLVFTPVELARKNSDPSVYQVNRDTGRGTLVPLKDIKALKDAKILKAKTDLSAHDYANMDDDEFVQPRDFTDVEPQDHGLDADELADLEAHAPKPVVNKSVAAAPKLTLVKTDDVAAKRRRELARMAAYLDDEDAAFEAERNPSPEPEEEEAVNTVETEELEDLDEVLAAPSPRSPLFRKPSPVKPQAKPVAAPAPKKPTAPVNIPTAARRRR